MLRVLMPVTSAIRFEVDQHADNQRFQFAHQHVVSDSRDQLLKSRAELADCLRRGDTGLPLVDTVRLLVDLGCPESRPFDLRPDERALVHIHFERA